jgi:hypothetical protein
MNILAENVVSFSICWMNHKPRKRTQEIVGNEEEVEKVEIIEVMLVWLVKLLLPKIDHPLLVVLVLLLLVKMVVVILLLIIILMTFVLFIVVVILVLPLVIPRLLVQLPQLLLLLLLKRIAVLHLVVKQATRRSLNKRSPDLNRALVPILLVIKLTLRRNQRSHNLDPALVLVLLLTKEETNQKKKRKKDVVQTVVPPLNRKRRDLRLALDLLRRIDVPLNLLREVLLSNLM